ncbi:MAG: lipid II:glycine glycyltransferase FemX [Chthoniobacterales bacterium]
MSEASLVPQVSAAAPNESYRVAATRPSASALATEFIDPLTENDWDAQVGGNPASTIFHSAAWAKVLHDTYAHRPTYLLLSQAGRSQALVPIMEIASPLTGRRGVTLPFSDFCGPLFSEQVTLDSLTGNLAALARERAWKYLEVRETSGLPPADQVTPTFYGHVLPLRHDADQLRDGFSSAVRRSLNKAERNDVSVEVTQTLDAVSQFYQLHRRTRRRHGAPPQPFAFFRNIHRHIIEPGLGFLVIATKASRPIAAAVFFIQGKSAVYKFGASDERQQEYRANNLVMWEAIKHLCSGGCRSLHFGRTSFANEGLRRFKLGWGAAEEPLSYRRLDPIRSEWAAVAPPSNSIAEKVFRRLPTIVNSLAGTLFYPHLD